MDVRLTLMVALGRRLGIQGHAQVAAAFLVTRMELCVNATPLLRASSRLLPSQVELNLMGISILQ